MAGLESNYPFFQKDEAGIKISLIKDANQSSDVNAAFLGKFKITEEEAEALSFQTHSAMVLVCQCGGYDYVHKVFKDTYTFDDDLEYIDGYVEGYFRLKPFDYSRRYAGLYHAHMSLGKYLSNSVSLDLSALAKAI